VTLNRILKILLIGLLCLAVFFGGVTVYANFFDRSDKAPDMPDIEKAKYSVYIKANGNMLLTNKYTQEGDSVYTLQGYWELIGNKYKHRDAELILDMRVFGEIEIRPRR